MLLELADALVPTAAATAAAAAAAAPGAHIAGAVQPAGSTGREDAAGRAVLLLGGLTEGEEDWGEGEEEEGCTLGWWGEDEGCSCTERVASAGPAGTASSTAAAAASRGSGGDGGEFETGEEVGGGSGSDGSEGEGREAATWQVSEGEAFAAHTGDASPAD